MNECDGSCNTVEHSFDEICVPKKMEDVNLKVLNMVKGMKEIKGSHKTYLT